MAKGQVDMRGDSARVRLLLALGCSQYYHQGKQQLPLPCASLQFNRARTFPNPPISKAHREIFFFVFLCVICSSSASSQCGGSLAPPRAHLIWASSPFRSRRPQVTLDGFPPERYLRKISGDPPCVSSIVNVICVNLVPAGDGISRFGRRILGRHSSSVGSEARVCAVGPRCGLAPSTRAPTSTLTPTSGFVSRRTPTLSWRSTTPAAPGSPLEAPSRSTAASLVSPGLGLGPGSGYPSRWTVASLVKTTAVAAIKL